MNFIFFRRIPYRAGTLDILYADDKIYIPRCDVEGALQYRDRRSLSKMRRRYPKEWLDYVDEGTVYHVDDALTENDAILFSDETKLEELKADRAATVFRTENGFLSLKTVVAIADRAQKFRTPATFLKGLQSYLSECAAAAFLLEKSLRWQEEDEAMYARSEREMLHQITLTLSHVERQVRVLVERMEREEKKNAGKSRKSKGV